MGDSKVIIVWMKGIAIVRNFQLRPLFYEIINIKNSINEVTFLHVYRERKILVDSLSKLGVQMTPSTWHIWAQQEGV
jgi:hypothetical protein